VSLCFVIGAGVGFLGGRVVDGGAGGGGGRGGRMMGLREEEGAVIRRVWRVLKRGRIDWTARYKDCHTI
jgi:hypothetical protein